MNKHTLKTRLLAPLLVVVTFLGISGINTTANASMISDKQTISDMSLQFVRYSTNATSSAIAWADKNTAGKAYVDPYRHSAPGRNSSLVLSNETLGLLMNPSEYNDPNDFMRLKVQNIRISANTAVSVVSRYLRMNRNGLREYWYLHKIWFKKIDGKWKINDYYTLLTKTKLNGQYSGEPIKRAQEQNLYKFYKGDIFGFDAVGTRFPR